MNRIQDGKEEAASDTSSLSATFSNAFNTTGTAFILHDESNFENALQKSTSPIQANPFNDSVPQAFSEMHAINIPGAAAASTSAAGSASASYASTPKKDADFRNVLAQNNNNLSAIFGGFNSASNKYECMKIDDDIGSVKNPFGGNKEKNNAWNELNALDLSRLQADLNVGENQSSIFACMNQIDQVTAKAPPKKEIPADFFNDVAKAAFSEFNTSTATRQKNHEFFNKISGFDCVRT